MRIIVTGFAGFVGSHTTEKLLLLGHTVLGIDNFSTGKFENSPPAFMDRGGDYVYMDVNDTDVDKIIRNFRPDAIIHLAAQAAISTSIEEPFLDMNSNIRGTLNLILVARRWNVKRFVFASTSAVYKEQAYFRSIKESDPLEPKSPYGVSKLAAEMYLRALLPSATILRYGNIYGPRQVPIGGNQVIAKMIRHFRFGDEFYIHGDGEQERDFIYVEDIVEANISAALLSGISGTYNIANGKSYSVNKIANTLAKVCGVPGYKWEHDDRQDTRRKVQMNVSAAKRDIGWYPICGLEFGLQRTVEWWEEIKS